MIRSNERDEERLSKARNDYYVDLLGVVSKPTKLFVHLKIFLEDGMFYQELVKVIKSTSTTLSAGARALKRPPVKHIFRDYASAFYKVLFDLIIYGMKEKDAYFRNCLAGKLFSRVLLDEIFEGSFSAEHVKLESRMFQALNHPFRMKLLFDLRDKEEPILLDDLYKTKLPKGKINYHLKLLEDQEAILLKSGKVITGRDFAPMLAAVDLIERTANHALNGGLKFGSIMYSKDDFEDFIWMAKDERKDYLRRNFYCSFEPVAKLCESISRERPRDELYTYLENAVFRGGEAFPHVVFEEDVITSFKLAQVIVDGGAIVVDRKKSVTGFILPNNVASVRQVYSHWVPSYGRLHVTSPRGAVDRH